MIEVPNEHIIIIVTFSHPIDRLQSNVNTNSIRHVINSKVSVDNFKEHYVRQNISTVKRTSEVLSKTEFYWKD